MRGLTVIATNNGFDYLEQTLLAEQKYGKWPVLVIDTCSSDPKFAPWASDVCKKYGVEFVSQSKPGYDLGAYAWAYQNRRDYDAYWFKHDSLYLKSKDFYPLIEQELLHYDFIGWHFFARWGSSFDNEEQRLWLVEHFGSDDYDYGFYGPNLAVKRETLDLLMPDVIIDTKMKQQAMERGWAILAKKNQKRVLFLENFKGDVKSDAYRFFIKAAHTSGTPRQ